ncbi:hypothetical protein L9F63_000685, partial [Diploptera punctata]
DTNSLEVRLEPSVREMLEAVRALLLATHWHSYTVLADSSASAGILLRRDVVSILKTAPLNPTLLILRSGAAARYSIFRRLADVSRATRGVILLLCDLQTAKQVTSEAKRLNMMSGHFVWLWIDTSASISIVNSTVINGVNLTSTVQVPKRRERTSNKVKYTEGPVKQLTSDMLSLRLGDLLGFRESPTSDTWLYQDNSVSPSDDEHDDLDDSLPIGLLALRPQAMKIDRQVVKGAVRLLADTLYKVFAQCEDWNPIPVAPSSNHRFISIQNSTTLRWELRVSVTEVMAGKRAIDAGDKVDKSMVASFDILNLVPEKSNTDYDNNNVGANDSEGESVAVTWKQVGEVTGRTVRLDTIVWPGGDLVVAGLSARARSVFRIVTALAPPFVMEGELDEDGQCLRGLACHRVLTSDKDNLTLVFNEMETNERLEEEEDELDHSCTYRTNCCYGLAMDLLENVAQELEFDFHLYIVADGLFGTKTRESKPTFNTKKNSEIRTKWNGIVGDLVSGAAHMSFAALSVSSARSEVIDFTVPYFFSGVSFLAAPTQKSEIPLLAFLLPFSPELWIAIFTSLNITAMAVAVYEWLSPFGLNPWGRQRSKNFSIASALWVMWGLLCGHLVAFKAPKSWPNKFLINVWGGFSVIFVASYTANIAALIAGLFFHNAVSNYHDRSLLSQRVGAPRASAADYYVHRANQHLWEHMQKFTVRDVEEGIQHLKNGSLDILIADTPILDYYRATDHGCKLQKIGDAINEDTYAVGMTKGFPLKDSISAVIAKYSSNGYMDILQEKWYGALPCFKLATDMAQPRPLGVAAVAGVFILLGLGMVLGCLILLFEHLFYRYTLPILRHQPKGTIWRSRNIMFFSQKLYRFINCVELVSPHHAARELVHTIRQGQITSLFQKSQEVKEHEQRRRRKSKAQFFEMIQEIRRVQQEERDQSVIQEEVEPEGLLKPGRRTSKDLLSPLPSKSSPRKLGKLRSPRALEARRFCKEMFSPSGTHRARRFSTDMIFSPLRPRLDCPSNAVGRRLSKDSGGCNSPPDINSRRFSNLDLGARRLETLDCPDRVQEVLCPQCSTIVDKPSRSFDKTSTSQEQINASPSPYSSLKKAQFRRRQSHQPRLETKSDVRHYHHRHRSRDSSHECDEVFDDIPPPPPPPNCQPRNGSNGESPLDRLNKEELVALWRSSESELRSHLLRAIRAKEVRTLCCRGSRSCYRNSNRNFELRIRDVLSRRFPQNAVLSHLHREVILKNSFTTHDRIAILTSISSVIDLNCTSAGYLKNQLECLRATILPLEELITRIVRNPRSLILCATSSTVIASTGGLFSSLLIMFVVRLIFVRVAAIQWSSLQHLYDTDFVINTKLRNK